MMRTNEWVTAVKPTEHRRLPVEFDLPHAVAFFYHDELASFVRDIESVGALSVHVELSEEEQSVLSSLSGEKLWEWLEKTDRRDVIYDLTYRQMTAAVLADACQFLSASLLASAKGKTTVAYSLLRKPLKENLLLVEWLCADPRDLLDHFHGESIDGYTLNRLGESKRREIMRRSAETAAAGMTEEILWTIRYAKEYPNSLETLWTKATHLVTSVRASSTEPGNLNFVFANKDAINDQWRHYYRIVPQLLFYFVSVAECVIGQFVEFKKSHATRLLLRNLAFFRFSEVAFPDSGARQGLDDMKATFEELEFACEACTRHVHPSWDAVDRFWLREEIACSNCGHVHDLWSLLGDEASDGTQSQL